MKRITFAALVAAVAIGTFFGYRSYVRHRDLKETLLWMDETYNPHEGGDNLGRGRGWEIHYLQKGYTEEITERFRMSFTQNGSCKVVVHSETLPEGVFSDTPSVSTYTFNLSDIDPESIKIKTHDLHKDVFDCADPEDVALYHLSCDNAEIEFKTRDDASVIDEQMVKTFTKLTGADHELRNASKTNKCWLVVNDVPYAQRLAKALKHAVELCGGTVSKF